MSASDPLLPFPPTTLSHAKRLFPDHDKCADGAWAVPKSRAARSWSTSATEMCRPLSVPRSAASWRFGDTYMSPTTATAGASMRITRHRATSTPSRGWRVIRVSDRVLIVVVAMVVRTLQRPDIHHH